MALPQDRGVWMGKCTTVVALNLDHDREPLFASFLFWFCVLWMLDFGLFLLLLHAPHLIYRYLEEYLPSNKEAI